jgi:hypothetical protein
VNISGAKNNSLLHTRASFIKISFSQIILIPLITLEAMCGRVFTLLFSLISKSCNFLSREPTTQFTNN